MKFYYNQINLDKSKMQPSGLTRVIISEKADIRFTGLCPFHVDLNRAVPLKSQIHTTYRIKQNPSRQLKRLSGFVWG